MGWWSKMKHLLLAKRVASLQGDYNGGIVTVFIEFLRFQLFGLP